MKNIPNLITMARVLGTVVLLTMEPFSRQFLIVYFLCGISDVLDGMIARKMNTVSKKGQMLDSVADAFMFIVLLSIFVSSFKLPLWGIYWIVAIVLVLFVISNLPFYTLMRIS